MTAEEKRRMVREKYRTIIGRNVYSQNLRDYCYRKYKDGKYYSDCSSSICYTYDQVGLGFGVLNTVGMWESRALTDVKVEIKKGIIQNPGALRVGDMLLFAGNDTARKNWGYVGHVEMVGEISGGTVWLYGHGSGNPKRHEMNAYCRTRYNTKASTPLGHRGLIRVRRAIGDDMLGAPPKEEPRELYNGCCGEDVRELQTMLISLGFTCGSWGADGDFGDATEQAVRRFQKVHGCEVDGVVGPETRAALSAAAGKVAAAPKYVRIVGGSCWVRSEPNTQGTQLGVAYEGGVYSYAGKESEEGWLLIDFNGVNGWVSGKYGRAEE